MNARLDQILAWDDPAHDNYSVLGAAAGMSRQAVQARAAKLLGDASGDELAEDEPEGVR
ncbi:hypothetical protein [Kitasatospora sp. KL5]|uniref:hypothetical protein n=1 Tax=Kitasatospora sp. KL5 TaxID=3425125 RepID=UPI003D6F1A97